MIEEFFKALNDHTRATYYVLPLISLNKFSFGPPENFINAYVNANGTEVIVRVKHLDQVYPKIWLHERYLKQEKDYFVFDIPATFWGDTVRFFRGKYSRMSEKAKELIRLNSGLNYRVDSVVNGKTITDTDARIRALSRDQELINKLENMLDITLGENDELMSPPGSEEVWVDLK